MLYRLLSYDNLIDFFGSFWVCLIGKIRILSNPNLVMQRDAFPWFVYFRIRLPTIFDFSIIDQCLRTPLYAGLTLSGDYQ